MVFMIINIQYQCHNSLHLYILSTNESKKKNQTIIESK